jgi:ribosomal protein S18 acetylase RimI-like enzyme
LEDVPIAFSAVSADDPDAQACLSAYYRELDATFATGFDPQHWSPLAPGDTEPPAGRFIVGRMHRTAIACGALASLGNGVVEVKRMWVSETVRGRGIGRAMLVDLEARAAAMGFDTVRLDTNTALTPAIAMYTAAGYRPIAPYNDNPYAGAWFEKVL